MKRIYIIILFVTLEACVNNSLDNNFLSDIKFGDTIKLNAYYSECGEWGGHHEIISLYKNHDKLFASYYKDTVFCEGDPNYNRHKVIEKEKEIDNNELKIIDKYCNNLLKEIIKREKIDHFQSNEYYSVTTKDSTYILFDEEKKNGINLTC